MSMEMTQDSGPQGQRKRSCSQPKQSPLPGPQLPERPKRTKSALVWFLAFLLTPLRLLANLCVELWAMGAKKVLRQFWKSGSRTVNIVATFLLHLQPGHYLYTQPIETTVRLPIHDKVPRTKSRPTPNAAPKHSLIPDPTAVEKMSWKQLTTRALKKVRKFPVLLKVPVDYKKKRIDVDGVTTTGLFDDIYWGQVSFIDHLKEGIKELLLRGHPWLFLQWLWIGLKQNKIRPRNLVETVDTRKVSDIIEDEGYEYLAHPCKTADGYKLELERIPNRKSANCVLFQHGVLDCSFAWVACGRDSSLAFLAWDEGHDVFLGNFRGNGGSYQPGGMDSKKYWNFNMNHHAFYDLHAFLQEIRAIKRSEGFEEVKISVVAHSMGGACLLAYTAKCGFEGRPTGIDRAIVLSPGGLHANIPTFCRLTGMPIKIFCQLLRINHFKLTSKFGRAVVAKLCKDIQQHPGIMRFMCYLLSHHLLGGSPDEFPLNYVGNMAYMFSGCGVSFGVFAHFWQMYRSGKFEAFDYGKTGNLSHYSTPEPPNFLEWYKYIRIPLFFVGGHDDTLIPASCVMRHYKELAKTNKQAYIKICRGGHVGMTMGMSDEILDYVIQSLGSVPGQVSPLDDPSGPLSEDGGTESEREEGEEEDEEGEE